MAEWNNVGRIQGEKGEQGEQGIQGIQGEKGEQGERGIQGLPGDDAVVSSTTQVVDGVSFNIVEFSNGMIICKGTITPTPDYSAMGAIYRSSTGHNLPMQFDPTRTQIFANVQFSGRWVSVLLNSSDNGRITITQFAGSSTTTTSSVDVMVVGYGV